MRKKTFTIFIILLICLLALSSCRLPGNRPQDLSSNGLKVGVATVDITPKETVGVDLSGYGHRASTGVHDPITARCLVVDNGNTEIALISLDFSNLSYPVIKIAIYGLAKASGISKEHIFIHATHTHSGPSLEYYRDHLKELVGLLQKVTQCVTSAKERKKDATAAIARGKAFVNTINREYPNREVENIVNAIEFRDSEKELISILVNFACHPVVLGSDNLMMSSDYVHFLRKHLEETLGGTTIFFSGSLGDINPQPIEGNYIADRTGGTFEMAQNLGEGIADGVFLALQDSEPLQLDIKIASKEINLHHTLTKISILSLGDVWIITIPGEPVSAFQQRLENSLPATTHLYFGLTHDRIGYIMPENEWKSFILKRPDEAHNGGEDWAEILENEYLLLAEEFLK